MNSPTLLFLHAAELIEFAETVDLTPDERECVKNLMRKASEGATLPPTLLVIDVGEADGD